MNYRILGALFSLICVFSPYVHAINIEQQRALYKEANIYLDNGNYKSFKKTKNKIQDYPLEPYLEYKYFNKNLKKHSVVKVKAFIKKYRKYPFIQGLHNRYLRILIARKDWANITKMQTTPPKREFYACNFYTAKLRTNHKSQAWLGAKKLWQSGGSISTSCNDLFDAWVKAKKRNNTDIINRMLLVFAKGNANLLTYLAKQTNDKRAQDIILLFKNPEKVIEFYRKNNKSNFNQELIYLTYKRLIKRDKKLALKLIKKTSKFYKLPQSSQLQEYLAIKLLRSDNRSEKIWRDKVLSKSSNQKYIEQRIRLSIENMNWFSIKKWLAKLNLEYQQKDVWVFWNAQLQAHFYNKKKAQQLYTSLLGKRNYYSMLAAREMNIAVDYPIKNLSADLEKIIKHMKVLDRIHELKIMHDETAVMREWIYLLYRCKSDELIPLAIYSHQYGWGNLSIQATIKAKAWDYMALRFPVVYKDLYEKNAKENKISITTLLALSRQESSLYSKATSGVGARGLMQVMPATAAEAARKKGLTYKGKNSLYDPKINICIGSFYFSKMLQRYNHNRILAFAAYNAGPNRLKKWLQRRSLGRLNAYSFIDMIPYKETRQYVQNALMFDLYYQKALNFEKFYLLTEKEANYRY